MLYDHTSTAQHHHTKSNICLSINFLTLTLKSNDTDTYRYRVSAFYAASLDSDQKSDFDQSWGLDTTGHFLEGPSGSRGLLGSIMSSGNGRQQQAAGNRSWLTAVTGGAAGNVQEKITDDLKAVRSRAEEELDELRAPDTTEKAVGKRLLELFQQDLLGATQGAVRENEYKYKYFYWVLGLGYVGVVSIARALVVDFSVLLLLCSISNGVLGVPDLLLSCSIISNNNIIAINFTLIITHLPTSLQILNTIHTYIYIHTGT